MEAFKKRVKKHVLEDSSFTVCSGMDSVVKNFFYRIRICTRVVCCIPIERVVPSEIFKRKSDVYRLRGDLSQTRAVRELRFQMNPKSRTSLSNKNREENHVKKLLSKTQISKSQSSSKDKISKDFEKNGKSLKYRSILKDRNKHESSDMKPKIDNPILDMPLKKQQLSFQTSENKLQNKKAKCRLFSSKGKKKPRKSGAEASDLNKSLRWRRKSSTSGKSSDNGPKCKKKPDSLKKSKKNKCVRLKFICSDSNSQALTSTEREVVGDGPAKGFNCENSPPVDNKDDFIMDYFKHGNKETVR